MQRIWKLKQDDDVLGVLTEVDSFGKNWIWIMCHFLEYPAFSHYKELFSEEADLINRNELGLCKDVSNKIKSLGLVLYGNNTTREIITGFIIHIDEDKAWFHINTS